MSVDLADESLHETLDVQFDVAFASVGDEGLGFSVRDELQADWALRRLQRVEERLGEIHALAAAERAVIDEWEMTESAKLQADHDNFSALLKAYMARSLELDPKRKTIRLPHGELKARTTAPRWSFDTSLFVEWASKARLKELLRIVVEPDKDAIKRTVQVLDGRAFLEGEPVEGVTVEAGETRFYVTAGTAPSPTNSEE